MHAFLTMSRLELRLLLREPLSAFFILAFPLLLLLVFGSIFGNDPIDRMGGRGAMDLSTPGYIAMIIGTGALISLPVTLASYRERGVLRRFQATPLQPAIILAAHLAVHLMITLVGALLLVGAGAVLFQLRMPAAPLALAGAVLFSSICFFAAGCALAAIATSARAAQTIGMAVFFPMLFLSGAALPRAVMPEHIQRIGDILPLTYVTNLLSDLWFGTGWNLFALGVLAIMAAVGMALAARFFRWE
jgi:ABC-2 type transport system permease protein